MIETLILIFMWVCILGGVTLMLFTMFAPDWPPGTFSPSWRDYLKLFAEFWLNARDWLRRKGR